MKDRVETYRSLSQLEGDIVKAEHDYIEADARLRVADANLQKAELQMRDAHYEREATLRTLNECHSELDRTIAMLREAAPIGCE